MITNAVTLEQGVTVTQLKGQIYLVAADGSRKLLAEGDVLPKGAVIMSPDGASFMGGGQSFTVQPASEQSEPAEEGDAPQLAQNGAAGTPDDISALQQAILGGADPTQAFEASAAGGAPAAGGGGIGGVAGASGNGGFVTIDRTGSATIAEATFDTTYNTNGEPPLGAAGEDEVFDLTPPTISVVAPDNTNDTTPTLTGTTDAPAGSTVTLLVTDANGNQQTLTAIVTPSGTFTVDVVTPLAEGSYTVTATVTDPAGNTGTATDNGSVDVTAPTITVDAPDNTTDTTPTITGTTNAAPGSIVTLVVTDANGTQQTLTAIVQPGGSYSVDVTTPLAEGSYKVDASVTDPAGNTGTATDDGSVDVTAPTISVDAPDNTNDTTPTITGTTDAPAGSTVTLVVTDANGNPQTLTATVQPGGGYSVDVTTPLAEGSYQVTASVTDPAGNTGTATDNGSMDVTSTAAPTVTIVDDLNNDELLSKGEIGADQVQVTAEVNHTELTAGGKVTLTITNGDASSSVELKLVNGVLQFANGTPATGFAYSNGTISWAENTPADGKSLTVSATQTDKAGNVSLPGSDTAKVDVTATDKPTVTIVDDSNPDDGLLSKGEIGADQVQVKAEVNHTELTAGGKVTLTITNGDASSSVELKLVNGVLQFANGTPATGFAYSNGTISWTENTPADGKSLTVSATQTDKAGNVSLPGSDTAKVDVTATDKPTVTIVDDSNPDDGLLSKGEIGADQVQVKAEVNHTELTAGGKVTLTITNGDASSSVELKLVNGVLQFADGTPATGFAYSNGTISWTENTPADGKSLTVSATQTDKAGNVSLPGSDTAKVDVTATDKPTVTIVDDSNPDDGLLSKGEIGADQVQVKAEVNHTELTAGGKVTLTITNGDASSSVELKLVNGVLQFANGTPATGFAYSNGTISWTENTPADGKSLTVSATQTDKAGNVSLPGSDTAKVDVTATDKPTVTIVDDSNPDDGLLSKGEIGADQVQVKAEVNHTELTAGGKVTLTITNGDASSSVELKLVNGVLQFADGTPATGFAYSNGTISWTENTPADGKSLTVSATQTDKAGNVSLPGSDTAKVDVTATDKPTVTIVDDSNPDDGLLSKGEIGADQVQVKAEVNHTELTAGGKVTLTITNGDASSSVELKLVNGVLQFADGTPATGFAYSNGTISWTENTPADGKSLTVSATQTDKAGNVSLPGSDTAKVDVTATDKPTVTIVDDLNNDELLSKGEIGADQVQVTAEVNHTELTAGGKVTLTITNGDASSSVELKLVNGVLQFADGTPATGFAYSNGTISWTENTPADGKSLTVSATQTDKAGNVSLPGSDTAKVDVTATDKPTVTIVDDLNNDELLSKGEIGADQVQVKAEVNHTELTAGGKVTLTITNGDASSSVELKLVNGVLQFANGTPATGFAYSNGTISWTENTPADGKSLTVSATQTDKAGNVSLPGSDTAKVDVTATDKPTVTIVDDSNPDDGLLSKGEIGADQVQVTAEVNHTELTAGGKVTLTITNGDASSSVELKLVNGVLQFADGTPATGFAYSNGTISWTENTPADGKSLTVSATQTDKAGNVSLPGSDTAKVDVTATDKPTVTIVDDSNPDDGLLSKGEIGADQVQVKAEVNHTELTAGGKVTLTITNGDASSSVELKLVNGVLQFANGTPATGFAYSNGTISWTENTPADGKSLTVSATQTDKAGNVSLPGSDTAKVDVTATDKPTVTIVDDSNPDDGLLSKGEIGADQVQVKAEVNHTELTAGGKVTLTITNGDASSSVELKLVNGVLQFADGTPATGFAYSNGTISWTENTPADGKSLTVSATQTDKAGNVSLPGSDTAKVDVTATDKPTVTIVDDSNPDDGLLSKGEIGADQVQVKAEVNHTELTAGGKVTLTITNGDASSSVELKLVNGVLQFADGTPATGFAYSNGTISWTENTPADGKSLTVSATQTDKAGNVSLPGSDTAKVDVTATDKPTVTIVDDSNPDDGLLSKGEIGADQVQVKAEVNHTELTAGGKVTLTITNGDASSSVELKLVNGVLQFANGTPATGFAYSNGTISWTENTPADGKSLTVSATQTDKAGNVSLPGSDTAKVDVTATDKPTVTIVDDSNPDDGLLSKGEIGADQVQVKAEVNHTELTAGGKVTLTITNGDASSSVELKLVNGVLQFADGTPATGFAYSNGTISWTENTPADGKSLTVSATQTDKAGNVSLPGSDTAKVDVTATDKPTVTIVDDSNPDDGLLSKGEIGADQVQVKAEVNHTELTAGGKVTLTITNGDASSSVELKLVNGVLQFANGTPATGFAYSNGTISWTENTPADGKSLTVSATQTDKAGNVSLPGSDTAKVDVTATDKPTVTIVDDSNPDDGLLSKGEIGADQVQVKAEVNHTELTAGGKVTLTITNGDASSSVELKLVNGVLQFADGTPATGFAYSNGTISWTENTPADGKSLTVSATQTDKAGNVSLPGSDTAKVDVTATDKPTVTIVDDSNPDDGLLSKGEIGADQVQVKAEVNHTELTAGGKVTLTISNGDASSSVELKLVNGVLQFANGTPATGFAYSNGTISWTENTPADGKSLTVSATQTDKAGNVSLPGSDTAKVDVTATDKPTVTIVDDSNPDDGLLSKGEIGADQVQVKAEVNHTELTAGGKVTLTISNGDASSSVELKLVNGVLQFANGTPATGFAYSNGTISWTENTPADGKSLTVSATQTDKAGNVSLPGSDTAKVDVTATDKPTVTIVDDLNNDELLSKGEIGADQVQVKAEVNHTELTAGGKVTLTITNGDASSSVELKLVNGVLQFANGTPATGFAYSNGTISWTENTPADGKSLTVSATQTDKAGNVSLPGSDTAKVDVTATDKPTVTIVDDSNPDDGLLSKGEIGADQVQVKAEVNHTELTAGGKVTLTITNGDASSSVELKLVNGVLQFANGTPATGFAYSNGTISWTENTPADGKSLTVSATQTDKAGNVSLPGSDTALVLAAPTTSGGYAQGEEDMPLTLKWSDFKASDVDTAADKLSIKITSLPADGVLQYKDANGNWQAVVENQVFTQAEIAAGKLQFKPDPHEASGSAGSGVNTGADGNKLGDYASFGYQVSDGVNSSGNATFVVDIKPVVDGVTLKVELVSGGFVPGAAKIEQILFDLNGKRPSPSPTGGDDYLVTNGSWVLGGGGNDTIKYGSGDHFLAKGEAGNDILIGGGSVTDNLDGGDGNDILIGGKNATSSVTLNAGAGNDTLIAQSLKASTSYYGGDGLDVAYMLGSMKDLKLVTTGLPQGCDYRLVYKDSSGALTNHDFYSVETLYLQDGKYEFKDGNLTKVAELATLKVDVDLIDTDGSEHFTELTIKGLPQGTLLSGGTLQADGSWKVPASMLDKDGKLSLQVELPVGSQNIKVTVVAGSQEYDMNGQPIAGEVKYTEADTGFMVKPSNPNGDNTVEGGRGDDVLLGDIGGIKTSVEPGKNYNIALIVDTSGSMQYGLDGRSNPPAGQDRMTLTIAALKVLANQLAGHDGVVNVTLVDFNWSASSVISINDLSKSNLQSLIDKISSLSAGGATNYEDAFIKATQWFNSKPGSSSGLTFENVTYFLTDGDPTVYNGNSNASESDAMQKAIDAFAPLSGLSEVKAIGIGNGVTKENLNYFDNTQVIGSGSQYGSALLLNDFSGNAGSWSANSWSRAGDSSGSVVRVSSRLELTDNAGNGSSVFASETLKIATGVGIRFDLSTSNNLSYSDSFSVQLQRWDGSTWVNVGVAVTSTGTINSGAMVAGDYRYVFTVTDVKQAGWDDTAATLRIDNLSKVTYPPVGQPDIITTADQLKAVLVGSSTTNTPAEVGADVLHGGAGNDILFGDAINTDHLPWGTAGNPAKPADWVDGKGLDGLTQFLTLKNGYAPSSLELYEYIKGNANSFDVAGDTRGGNDKLHGGLGDDILFGQGGDDELYGDDGKDILYGGTGSDKLDGGAGNDILSGGLGNDILTGGDGADIFVWNKGDTESGKLTVDTVTDFKPSLSDPTQRDKLDLSDLLDHDGSKTESLLKNLLSVSADSQGVHLKVSDSVGGSVTQEIVLSGHTFGSLTGNSSATASQVIDYMLTNNMLDIDK
ncbi:retention module-containing protein [Aeromonas sp. FDAARGOS 1416]|nr:retention module-containing protein [Aeromonas sp. FDAARGOS 1416]QXB00337.1 retention module-containing protein [Aeromonas sp. FDAARGOS 1416]